MTSRSSTDAPDEPPVPAIEDAVILPDAPDVQTAAPDPVLEIIDESPPPAAAPQATLPPPPPPAPRRRSGFLPALAGGVIAAGLGFGVAQVVPDGWPMAGTAQLEATLAQQAQEIARLSSALAALPPPAPAPDLSPITSDIAALADRLTATESSLAALPAATPPPPDPTPRIEVLSARIAALESLPPGTVIEGGSTGGDPAALAALQQEIAALQSDLAAQAEATQAASAAVAAAASEAQAALDAATAEAAKLQAGVAAAATSAAADAALGRVQAALETGAPYASAVEALTAAGASVAPVLADNAATGLPTLAALQEAFPAAARAALDASLRADMGETTAERLGSFLRTQTGARSLEPREGSDPDAVLSRAEAALRDGQLDGTLTEIALLPEPGQAALADWVAQAKRRIDAAAAMQALSAALDATQGGG